VSLSIRPQEASARSAFDSGGLPSEKMSIDDPTMQVMVKISETEVSGIMEILNRHEPTKIL
jgi:hypothetical protein